MEEAWELAALKIFASWSGDLSRELALAFGEWLPKVLQGSSVFVSKKDIHSGENWLSVIIEHLQDSDFGIAFVTQKNLESPWLQFESGALALKFSKARITPLLCGIDNTKLSSSNPLSRFQAEEFNQEGIMALLLSIVKSSKSLGISTENLEETYELWMSSLFEKSDEIFKKFDSSEIKEVIPSTEVSEAGAVKSVLSDLVGEVRSLSARIEKNANVPSNYGVLAPTIGVANSLLNAPFSFSGPAPPNFAIGGYQSDNQLKSPAIRAMTAILRADNLNDLYQIDELVAEESEYYSESDAKIIGRELKVLRDRLEPK